MGHPTLPPPAHERKITDGTKRGPSTPPVQVELARLVGLHGELLRTAATHPKLPRAAPARVSPVLKTVTLVLEQAERPIRAWEIHAATEELAGQPLL